jgi:hypothetical protein
MIESCNYDYLCKKCNFFTNNKKDFERHIKTPKHEKQQELVLACDICNKIYKSRSGLWKHKKTAHKDIVKNVTDIINKEDKTEKKIDKLEKMVITALEDNKRTIDTLLPNIGNIYNTTNKMTINVFLNEQCKDAINMNTFVNNLKLSFEDLQYTTNHGYVKGISNIFLKNLHNLKPTERPIHCSDKKRMHFYIKDEDEWKKPTDSNARLDKTISQVSHKQIKEIKEWEQKYPYWNKSDKETEMYLKMIQQVMGGKNDVEIQKNKNDIKKELGNKIELKKAIENT